MENSRRLVMVFAAGWLWLILAGGCTQKPPAVPVPENPFPPAPQAADLPEAARHSPSFEPDASSAVGRKQLAAGGPDALRGQDRNDLLAKTRGATLSSQEAFHNGGGTAPSSPDGQEKPLILPVAQDKWPAFRQAQEPGVKLVPMGTGSLWVAVGPKDRTVLIQAEVCLRRGFLEHLLCLKGTKEHEAILAASIDPEAFHAALLLAGAEPGSPVQFQPEFRPPCGPKLRVQVEWWDGKQFRRRPAQDWVLEEKTRRPMSLDWVFAGSTFVTHPETGERYYLGRQGDLITVANMVSAVVDVSGPSSAANAELLFVANEKLIPPRGSPVLVLISPVPTMGSGVPDTRQPTDVAPGQESRRAP
jgi:hypothetical protein